MDKKLDALLDLYQVEAPDDVFVSRIMNRISGEPLYRVARPMRGLRVAGRLLCVMLCVALGAAGFWLGGGNVPVRQVSADSGYFDDLIIAPSNAHDMTL